MVCICAAVSLALALTNLITAPVIRDNLNAAANAALLEVMPDGKGFEKIDISGYELPAAVTEAHGELGGGHVLRLVFQGYKSQIELMVGVKADGTVSGISLLQCGDTWPDKVEAYGSDFIGKDASGVGAVDTVGGMTVSSAAYRAAVKDALDAAALLRSSDNNLNGGAENEK